MTLTHPLCSTSGPCVQESRLVLLTPSVSRQGGGLLDAVRNLAQALHRSGEALLVLAPEDEQAATDLPHWLPAPVSALRRRGPAALGYAPDLLTVLNRANPELVHCHGLWMYPSFACLRWHRRTARPYLVSPHGMLASWALSNSVWKKWAAGLFFQNAHLGRAACVHALREAEAQDIRRFGLTNPVCIVPNGVELPKAEVPDRSCRNGESHRTLLFLGRLHPKKGLGQLIHGWQMARSYLTRAGWRLRIVGWGADSYRDELGCLVRQLDLTADIEFSGPLFGDDKDRAFADADAFVLPSLSEGMPMAVLEAWSWRLPALLTPACNLSEGFAAGAAIRADHEAADLARALTDLAGLSSSELQIMGDRGRSLVEQRFNWQTIASQMRSVYDWILGDGAVPACVDRGTASDR